jgi:hypothetical protein
MLPQMKTIMCTALALFLLMGLANAQAPRGNDTASIAARIQRLEDIEEIRKI